MTMEPMKASHLACSAFVNLFSLLTFLTTTKHTQTHTHTHTHIFTYTTHRSKHMKI